MYNQIREDTLFLMFYASVAMLALIACCYLLFRRANAIAPDVTPPVRLRRWTAAFFATIAWPVCVIMAPLVVGLAWYIVSRSDDFLLVLFVYFLLMWLGVIIYMARAIRQYGRWLRDNYADLEYKEVWQGFVVLAIYLLVYAIYSLDVGEQIYEYAMEVIIIVLVCYLLWRVETLSDLSIPEGTTKNVSTSATLPEKNIGLLLKQHCEEQQLYLQYDISLPQLAQTIGTNRLYLSQYFSSQGITYNAYINGLRIQYFINLYHETVASHQPISVQQLAHQSGFRSYSTFNGAFKQNMGMTATEWMHNVRTSES